MNTPKTLRLSGIEVTPYIQDLARLRIRIFRDFPYLYDGSAAYEETYLKRYTTHTDTVIVLVLHESEIVGASTGMPLSHEHESIRRPFEEGGWNPDEVFYFGESVLLDAFRGRGLGVRFFTEREAFARERGYTWCAFCAVERPYNHPLRPDGYTPLDSFWKKRGFTKKETLWTTFKWKDIDMDAGTDKKMTFWVKKILHSTP